MPIVQLKELTSVPLKSVSSRLVCLVWWVVGPGSLLLLLLHTTSVARRPSAASLQDIIQDEAFTLRLTEGTGGVHHVKVGNRRTDGRGWRGGCL